VGVPFFALAADLGHPVKALVFELLHLLDAFHEPRELFELRPLVVGGANRNVNFDARIYSQCETTFLIYLTRGYLGPP
jgi:hypothetical protein